MYETHFGFHRQPFQSADACRAFFVSESISEILPQLLHALRSDLGIAVLTGVPGSGKTSLLRYIQQQLSNEGRVIVCSGAHLGTSADLIAALLQVSRMTSGTETTTKPVATEHAMQGSRSSALNHMKRTAELWGPVLLLIDDIQLVPLPVLNELRACTEEEWNGRDLVRCLVAAPISFEDQLARQEYSDFARRIRCHTFLQPLKSSESILFLKDQIELAGGRISNVFTTPALESITAAAGGNPRCLGLLADETLVVAAMIGENIASENSVRTALSRLQHLQYNWNTSPHTDIAGVTESDSEPTDIEIKSTEIETVTSSTLSGVSSSATQTANRSHPPNQAAIAPGVIEFGGPAHSTTPSTNIAAAMAMSPAPIQPGLEVEDHSDLIDVSECVELPVHMRPIELTEQRTDASKTVEESSLNFDDQALSDIDQIASIDAAVEIASAGSSPEAFHAPTASKTDRTKPGFEVGQRFISESTQESISIDDVEDSDILELLSLGAELDFANTVTPSTKTPAVSEHIEVAEAKIVWFDGNANAVETQVPVETDVANTTSDDDNTSPAIAQASEQAPAGDSLPAMQTQNVRSERDLQIAATSRRFFDPATATLANRLPVFDRYTWLALGRDVPAGRSSVVSMSATRQLIQADYAMLPSESLAPASSRSANSQRTTSIDHIPIYTTTDAALIEEITQKSFNTQSETYPAICAEDLINTELSTILQSPKVDSVVTTRDAAGSLNSTFAVEILHDETQDVTSQIVSDSDTIEDSAANDPHSISGLRIWRDGMLVFPNGESTDDATVTSNDSNDVVHQVVETTAESDSIQSAYADENFLQRNLFQLGAGGFFTLPEPRQQHTDELNSLKISADEDVYPFVEAINRMRADIRSFQDTGSVPVEDSDPVSRFTRTADTVNQTNNVVSRAKRRLDEQSNTADSQTIALQVSPEVRVQQETQSEVESIATPDGALNTDSALKFGSLFTRLRETRNRASDQTLPDA